MSGAALVVDDSVVNRRLLVRHLERLGLTTSEAENGLEALEAAACARGRASTSCCSTS